VDVPASGTTDNSLLYRRARRRKVVVPTRDEIRAVIKATTPEPGNPPTLGQALIQTIIFAGLRNGEWRALAWPSVHLDARPAFIRVERRADRWNEIGEPKSAAGRRDVQIPRHLVETLTLWRQSCPKSNRNLVFPNGDGGFQNHANIQQRAWGPLQISLGMIRPKNRQRVSRKTLAKETKEPNAMLAGKYGLHALRHAFARLQIDAGVDPKKLQEQMGHASIQMTYDTYGGLWKDQKRDLDRLKKIESWINAA
jgi:integrase